MNTIPAYKFDPDVAAKAIKVTFAIRNIKIKEYAKQLGVTRQLLSAFLNRHLDLRQDQLEWVLDDLGIRHLVEGR
jgi:hypothetical protein